MLYDCRIVEKDIDVRSLAGSLEKVELLNFKSKIDHTNMQLMAFSAYQIIVARNLAQQSTFPFILTSDATVV